MDVWLLVNDNCVAVPNPAANVNAISRAVVVVIVFPLLYADCRVAADDPVAQVDTALPPVIHKFVPA